MADPSAYHLSISHSQGEGTNFSFTGHTALHWAAAKGHAAAVRWLLAAGASPRATNKGAATPLHAAAANQHMHCAEVLMLLGHADAKVVGRERSEAFLFFGRRCNTGRW